MITQVTDAQWEQVEELRKKWLNEYQTEQFSVSEIVNAAKKFAPENVPIWVVDSPIIARIISAITKSLLSITDNLYSNLRYNLDANLDANLRDNLYSNLDSNLRANLDFNLRSNLRSNLSSNLDSNLDSNLRYNLDANLDFNLRSNLDSNLYDNLDSNLSSNLYSNLSSNLYANLSSNLDSNLSSNLDSNLSSNLRSNLYSNLNKTDLNYYCGVWWNAWCGWYDGGEILGVPRHEKHDLFSEWNHICPIWMWDDRQIFILRKPKEIHWRSDESTGLHCDTGPAVFYSDFFKLWFIEGICVDEQIVMAPETQTIEQIEKEENEEIRRIRIKRFGWERFLKDSNAVIVESRRNDRDAQEEKLYKLGNGMKRISLIDPSTGRKYFLGVPRETETCQQAQNWMSHGLDKFAIHRS